MEIWPSTSTGDARSGVRMCNTKKRPSGDDHLPKCTWNSSGVGSEVMSGITARRRASVGGSEAAPERSISSPPHQ
eukprot:4128392-Prorocentrum_lima.AAC.1